MKSINSRFITSNIISSVILIFSIPLLREQQKNILHGTDIVLGVFILSIFIMGLFIRIKKSREIARNSTSNWLNNTKKLIIGLFFLFGFATTMNFIMGSYSYIFGDRSNIPLWADICKVCFVVFSLLILIYEVFMISGEAKLKPVKPTKWLNPLYNLYVGVAIAFSWDIMVVGGSTQFYWGMEDFWPDFIGTIFLAVMFIMSVQRLFWYELFNNSSGWKDNLKITASIVLVIASAMTPLFFKR